MNEKTLDLSALSDIEVAKVKTGLDQFLNDKSKIRYFGAVVGKKDLKKLCKLFGYCDTRSWIGGAICGATAMFGGMAYCAYKHKKETLETEKTEN